MFIRVRDPVTGHQFDVPETDFRVHDGTFQLVNKDRYPPSPTARRPKHNINPPRVANDKES